MDLDIFNSEQEKREAQIALKQLTDHEGWKFIIRALEANITYLARELRERKDFTSLEQIHALQDRLNDIEAFKELPTTIIQSIEAIPEEEDPEVYDS